MFAGMIPEWTRQNIRTGLYASVSTNGGISFTVNENVSDVTFNPNNMVVGQPGGENYIGDYIGNSPSGTQAIMYGWTQEITTLAVTLLIILIMQ